MADTTLKTEQVQNGQTLATCRPEKTERFWEAQLETRMAARERQIKKEYREHGEQSFGTHIKQDHNILVKREEDETMPNGSSAESQIPIERMRMEEVLREERERLQIEGKKKAILTGGPSSEKAKLMARKRVGMEGRGLLRTDVLWRAAVKRAVNEGDKGTIADSGPGMLKDEMEEVEI
ncbi:hypothetical protein K458DRAFT_404900 [Lentithecium fluviatile CBS 122367]|uniref:Uncharacterized protein n=1 Tax=Lentithecium fluviatile CBS 122367 TaxID=1168545 RepID=A0A6G1IYJ7_9PLEO|nr:hypothetical protein K458DRAFT_404900 [Lentithecium fluviatile CBS 122367]